MAVACTDSSGGGSYSGTLTLSTSNQTVVTAAIVNVLPEQDGVELFPTEPTSTVRCALQGMAASSTALRFDCSTSSCRCDTPTIQIWSASGTLSADTLTLSFGGQVITDELVSGVFTGALVDGTR